MIGLPLHLQRILTIARSKSPQQRLDICHRALLSPTINDDPQSPVRFFCSESSVIPFLKLVLTNLMGESKPDAELSFPVSVNLLFPHDEQYVCVSLVMVDNAHEVKSSYDLQPQFIVVVGEMRELDDLLVKLSVKLLRILIPELKPAADAHQETNTTTKVFWVGQMDHSMFAFPDVVLRWREANDVKGSSQSKWNHLVLRAMHQIKNSQFSIGDWRSATFRLILEAFITVCLRMQNAVKISSSQVSDEFISEIQFENCRFSHFHKKDEVSQTVEEYLCAIMLETIFPELLNFKVSNLGLSQNSFYCQIDLLASSSISNSEICLIRASEVPFPDMHSQDFSLLPSSFMRVILSFLQRDVFPLTFKVSNGISEKWICHYFIGQFTATGASSGFDMACELARLKVLEILAPQTVNLMRFRRNSIFFSSSQYSFARENPVLNEVKDPMLKPETIESSTHTVYDENHDSQLQITTPMGDIIYCMRKVFEAIPQQYQINMLLLHSAPSYDFHGALENLCLNLLNIDLNSRIITTRKVSMWSCSLLITATQKIITEGTSELMAIDKSAEICLKNALSPRLIAKLQEGFKHELSRTTTY